MAYNIFQVIYSVSSSLTGMYCIIFLEKFELLYVVQYFLDKLDFLYQHSAQIFLYFLKLTKISDFIFHLSFGNKVKNALILKLFIQHSEPNSTSFMCKNTQFNHARMHLNRGNAPCKIANNFAKAEQNFKRFIFSITAMFKVKKLYKYFRLEY